MCRYLSPYSYSMTTDARVSVTALIPQCRTSQCAAGSDPHEPPEAAVQRKLNLSARDVPMKAPQIRYKRCKPFGETNIDALLSEAAHGESASLTSSPSKRPSRSASVLVPYRPFSAPSSVPGAQAVAYSSPPASARTSSGTVSPTLSFSLTDSPVAPKLPSPSKYSRTLSLDVSSAATGSNPASIPTPRLGNMPAKFSNGAPATKSSSCYPGIGPAGKPQTATVCEVVETTTLHTCNCKASGSPHPSQSALTAEPDSIKPSSAACDSDDSVFGSCSGDRARRPGTSRHLGQQVRLFYCAHTLNLAR